MKTEGLLVNFVFDTRRENDDAKYKEDLSMWQSIPSLEPIVQALATAFTSPSFQTQVALLLGWVMCVGKRTE